MKVTLFVVLLSAVLLSVIYQCNAAAKLPVWVKNCPQKGSMPINECIPKRLRDAWPFILKGYPKYRIPPLEPLKVSAIAVGSKSRQVGLELNLTNVDIWGLRNTVFDGSKFDIENRSIDILWSDPRVEVLGHYAMDGKILVLPIEGDGAGNITLTDVAGNFKIHWNFHVQNGKRYLRIDKSSMDFNVGHAYFHFKNLFNGDKRLGDQMNNFLNDNWMDVIREFGPAVGDAFGLVFRQILQNGFQLAPFDSFFPESEHKA